jgi:hypothetical protein
MIRSIVLVSFGSVEPGFLETRFDDKSHYVLKVWEKSIHGDRADRIYINKING